MARFKSDRQRRYVMGKMKADRKTYNLPSGRKTLTIRERKSLIKANEKRIREIQKELKEENKKYKNKGFVKTLETSPLKASISVLKDENRILRKN